MQIRKKSDVNVFLTSFSQFADSNLNKLYFTFPWEHNGTITVMKYPNAFSVHRKNDVMWDLHEVAMDEKEIEHFIWSHRRFINPVLKEVNHASSIK
jgi:hypothetical protein